MYWLIGLSLVAMACNQRVEEPVETRKKEKTIPEEKIPPKLAWNFEKSSESQQLRQLFESQFEWHKLRNEIHPRNNGSERLLQDFFKVLESSAGSNPALSKTYNQLGILSYYYLSSPHLNPQEKGLLYLYLKEDRFERAPKEKSSFAEAYKRLKGLREGVHPELDQETNICRKAMTDNHLPAQSCPLQAALLLAGKSADPFDNLKLKHDIWNLFQKDLDRHHEKQDAKSYLQSLDPLFTSAIKQGLHGSGFGEPLSLETVDSMVSKSNIIATQRKITLQELNAFTSPQRIFFHELPKEFLDLAKTVRFNDQEASQLGLSKSEATVYHFLKNNLRVIYWVPQEKDFPDPSLLGQMESPYRRSILLNIQKWKSYLQEDYLKGVLATLSHEAYHIYHFRHLLQKEPAAFESHLLDERNGHLMSAKVLEALFPAMKKQSGKSKQAEEVALKIVGYYLDVYGPNALLGYPEHDESFRTDLSSSIKAQDLSLHPERSIPHYFKRMGEADIKSYLLRMGKRLNYNFSEKATGVLIRR
ncbi:MAG: hypothetical protein JNK65_08770 [Deltaproteobacteria bacterium]|nr:hypothetical protein [Deltaproteobacteria bacterium]